MLPIAWITCCFLLGTLVGTVSKAAKGPFMVLARKAYSTSISPQTLYPSIAPPIDLPTLTDRVNVPIWPGSGLAVDVEVTCITTHPASYLASYDVYSKTVSGWLANDRLALVPVVGGVSVLLAVLVYLVCTSSVRHSKLALRKRSAHDQPLQTVDRAVSTVDGIPTNSQFCVHPCSVYSTDERGPIDGQVIRNITTDFDRISAELIQLREGVDALVAHITKVDETLHRLNATQEELRGIFEALNNRSPRGSSDVSSSNPWVIACDGVAVSNAHFSSDSSYIEDTDTVAHRNPATLDDDADSQYLSTALGLTNWSEVPPRNGYYPTLDLLLARSERGRGTAQEAWYVPSDELRAWIFPKGHLLRVDKCGPTSDADGGGPRLSGPSESG